MGIFKGSVLIVDSEEPIRRMLLSILSRECYYCVSASSGQDALDKSVVSDFDVVLLDAIMPGMPGIEVLPRLKELCHDARIIMILSTLNREVVEESMHLGACDYITKPLNTGDVVSRVESAMASKRATLDKKHLADSWIKPLTP